MHRAQQRKKKKNCPFGVNKKTGTCLKNKRRRK